MTNPTRPPIASRWRRKRVRAYDHWLRVFISRPASTVASMIPVSDGCATSLTCATSGFFSPSGGSVIPNSRIEIAVENVGDEVGRDDDHGRDHQICHDGIDVLRKELLDEVVADA